MKIFQRLFLLFFLLLPTSLFAETKGFIQEYLRLVSDNSLKLKSVQLENSSQLKLIDNEFAPFDWDGNLSLAYTKSDNPPNSPFSSATSRSFQLDAGVQKLWRSGFSTGVNYSLVDNLTSFLARADTDYYSPDVSLKFQANLLQDLFSERLSLVAPKVGLRQESLHLNTKLQKKTILVESLLALTSILELVDEISLQKDICASTAKQTRKLEQKRRRRSVSAREYFISKKDLNNCLANIKNLEKDLFAKKEDLQVSYRLNLQELALPRIDEIFTEVSLLFQKEFQAHFVDFSKTDELLAMKTQMELIDVELRQLNALKRVDLKAGLTLGIKGLNKDFSDSHADLSDFNYPYVSASIALKFPFGKRNAENNSASKQFQLASIQQQWQQSKLEKESRFHVLQESLQREYSIYQDYLLNVELSEKVLKEAERDFNNGRIDLFSLSEFQKRLIESRRQLAKLRAQVIVKTVEYVDYFQFFDTYFSYEVFSLDSRK